MTVITTTNRKYTVITTYNNEFAHWKVQDNRGRMHLLEKELIKKVIK